MTQPGRTPGGGWLITDDEAQEVIARSFSPPPALKNLIFVDCEAYGPCPAKGTLTEFGAVEYSTRAVFHGQLLESHPNPDNPAQPIPTGAIINPPEVVFMKFDQWLKDVCTGRPIFVSDNPAYDWQWINDGFWVYLGHNPFGHSGRRISDFYAGLTGDFRRTQDWKALRVTPHDHNPVNDALGNVEAFARLLAGERPHEQVQQ